MTHGDVVVQKEGWKGVCYDTSTTGFYVVSPHSGRRALRLWIWAGIRGQCRHEEFRAHNRRPYWYENRLGGGSRNVVQRRAMRDPARSSHSRPGCPPRLLMRPHSGSRSNAASRPSRILEYRPTPGGPVPDIAGTEPVGRPAQASRATATVFGMIYCRVGG